jgi:hypothetical protein
MGATTPVERALRARAGIWFIVRVDQIEREVIDVLTISKPLSAAQVRAYHAEEFGNARENYYTATDKIRGQWHGQLAPQ